MFYINFHDEIQPSGWLIFLLSAFNGTAIGIGSCNSCPKSNRDAESRSNRYISRLNIVEVQVEKIASSNLSFYNLIQTDIFFYFSMAKLSYAAFLHRVTSLIVKSTCDKELFYGQTCTRRYTCCKRFGFVSTSHTRCLFQDINPHNSKLQAAYLLKVNEWKWLAFASESFQEQQFEVQCSAEQWKQLISAFTTGPQFAMPRHSAEAQFTF